MSDPLTAMTNANSKALSAQALFASVSASQELNVAKLFNVEGWVALGEL